MRHPGPKPTESALAARLRAVQDDLTKSEAVIAQWLVLNLSLIHISEPTRPY